MAIVTVDRNVENQDIVYSGVMSPASFRSIILCNILSYCCDDYDFSMNMVNPNTINSPIIMLRNVKQSGLCNGTRLEVEKLMDTVIQASIPK